MAAAVPKVDIRVVPGSQKGGHWNAIGIGILVAFVAVSISATLLGFYSRYGFICSMVSYALFALLIFLAIFGKRIQSRSLTLKPETKTIDTQAGGVQLASGAAGSGPLFD